MAAARSIRCSLRPVRAGVGVTVALLCGGVAVNGSEDGNAGDDEDAGDDADADGGGRARADDDATGVDAGCTAADTGLVPGPPEEAPCGGMMALGPPGGTVVVVICPGCAYATLGQATSARATAAIRRNALICSSLSRQRLPSARGCATRHA